MIEVGEYVRTKNGTLFKVIGGNADDYDIDIPYCELAILDDCGFTDVVEMFNNNDNGKFIEEIVKTHSKDLIDLIEPGDYVNGIRASSKDGDVLFISTPEHRRILKEPIDSVVTWEQFEQIKYKVKENQ